MSSSPTAASPPGAAGPPSEIPPPAPMRSVRVLRNVVTNYLRQISGGLIGFLVAPIMVHALGDGRYGLWVTIFSLTGYFGLFDQGIRPSLVRYVSRDHARGDIDGLSRTLNSALVLYGSVGLLTFVATLIVAATFPYLPRVNPGDVGLARQVILLAGLSLAIGFPLGVYGAALSGLQRYDIANVFGIGVALLRGVLFVVVLRLGGGLIALAWVSLATNLLGHVLSWVCVRRLLPQARYGRSWVTRAQLALIGSYSGLAFLGAVANNIAFQTDALVITAFLGTALVTPFSLAASLVESTRLLIFSATWVLAPTASELDTRGEHETLHEMVVAGCKYSVLVCWPALFALLVFGGNLLVTWVGPDYESSKGLLNLLAAPTLLSLPQAAAASVLYGVSRHRGVVMLAVANALLNLLLSILWVKPYGLVGVALGTAVPLVFVGGILTIGYTCRALRMPVWRYLVDGMLRPGAVTLAFLVPALIVQRLAHPLGWVPLGAAVFGCWLVFLAVAWRLGVTAGERRRWSRMLPGLVGLRTALGGAGR